MHPYWWINGTPTAATVCRLAFAEVFILHDQSKSSAIARSIQLEAILHHGSVSDRQSSACSVDVMVTVEIPSLLSICIHVSFSIGAMMVSKLVVHPV